MSWRQSNAAIARFSEIYVDGEIRRRSESRRVLSSGWSPRACQDHWHQQPVQGVATWAAYRKRLRRDFAGLSWARTRPRPRIGDVANGGFAAKAGLGNLTRSRSSAIASSSGQNCCRLPDHLNATADDNIA